MSMKLILEHGYFVAPITAKMPSGNQYADPHGDVSRSGPHGHILFGDNNVSGATCPNCAKPLLSILSLDMTDPRLGSVISPASTLPLLYCWRCNVVLDTLYYKVYSDGSVQVLEYAKGVDEGLGDDYPDAFPAAKALLLSLSPEAQAFIHSLNEDDSFDDSEFDDDVASLDRCVHQVGGEPYLVNGDSYGPIMCPECAKSMPLLASMGTQCTDPRGMLIDEINNFVQIIYHYCQDCGIIGALNEAE